MTKQCTDCRKTLPVDCFYFVSKASGKLRGQCKECMRASKAAQRDPEWTPECSRCGVRLPSRSGSGRRLCPTCYAESYDLDDVRESGSHRLKLKPCTLCRGPKERFERGKLCGRCSPWESYAKSLRRFGLTPDDYVMLLEAQAHVCAICLEPEQRGRLRIDHDHSLPEGRSAVRGLICNVCNYNRLPLYRDDPHLLRRAATYLSQPPARLLL